MLGSEEMHSVHAGVVLRLLLLPSQQGQVCNNDVQNHRSHFNRYRFKRRMCHATPNPSADLLFYPTNWNGRVEQKRMVEEN